MTPTPQYIQRVYLLLLLLHTLASSLIWGINTIFLLDAGLSNTEAFLANAFFTLGQVIFEVPTGIVADTRGRKVSYLLGTVTLAFSTLGYLVAWSMSSPLWIWAIASILLGLGFTFFSGATEAWLVDAMEYAKFDQPMDGVFAKGQIISGGAMLVGSVAGGVIAQASTIAVPYVLRAGILLLSFLMALLLMKDWGFEPKRSANVMKDMKKTFIDSFQFSFQRPALRWVMISAPFLSGVGFYAFYAMQPFLLELYGDETAYGIAGLAAAIVAGAQIIGGICVPRVRKFFSSRTTLLMSTTMLSLSVLLIVQFVTQLWMAIGLLSIWGFVFAISVPVRQAYVNGMIPSKQRATVLSFDSLLGSAGGAVIQPGLGKSADLFGYGSSFAIGGVVQMLAIPFLFASKREKHEADAIE